MNRLESVDKKYKTATTPTGYQFHDMHTECCNAQRLLHTFF